VILGVVVQAIWGLAAKALGTTRLRLLAGASALLALLGVHELAILFGAGAAAAALARARSASGGALRQLIPVLPLAAGSAAASSVSLASLFGVFLKIGSVLFGSGYVLLAFLRADLVERLGWLSEAQLIDAVAVGQITPGPVFSTATFIGYVLAGPAGAAVATIGIFLPAFVFVALSGPLIPRLRASPTAAAFLDGVNAASLVLMAVVTLQLARAAFVDLPTVALGAASALLLVRYQPNSTWLVLGGALAGWLLHTLQ
jgi:chromate transporter